MNSDDLPFYLEFGATGIVVCIASYIVKSVLYYF